MNLKDTWQWVERFGAASGASPHSQTTYVCVSAPEFKFCAASQLQNCSNPILFLFLLFLQHIVCCIFVRLPWRAPPCCRPGSVDSILKTHSVCIIQSILKFWWWRAIPVHPLGYDHIFHPCISYVSTYWTYISSMYLTFPFQNSHVSTAALGRPRCKVSWSTLLWLGRRGKLWKVADPLVN